MARVLVTGAAGFIGHQLCSSLEAQGHMVVGVDNLSVPSLLPPRAALIREDVRALTADFFRRHRFDRVVHLAAKKSVSASFRRLDHAVENFEMSLRLLDACARGGVARVFLAGSCEMYGDSASALDEQSPYRPRSPYAVSKVAGEHLAEVYMQCNPRMKVTSLRFFNIYGPTEGVDAVIPCFVTRALRGEPIRIEGDGEQSRDFTYIDDAVRVILSILDDEARQHRSINISSGQSHTVREVAAAVRAFLPHLQVQHVPGRQNEIQSFPSSNTRIRECYGFRPRTSLLEGVAKVIRFHQRTARRPAARLQPSL